MLYSVRSRPSDYLPGHNPEWSVCSNTTANSLNCGQNRRLSPLPRPWLLHASLAVFISTRMGCDAFCTRLAPTSLSFQAEQGGAASGPRAGVQRTESGRAGVRSCGLTHFPASCPKAEWTLCGRSLWVHCPALKVLLTNSILLCKKAWARPMRFSVPHSQTGDSCFTTSTHRYHFLSAVHTSSHWSLPATPFHK